MLTDLLRQKGEKRLIDDIIYNGIDAIWDQVFTLQFGIGDKDGSLGPGTDEAAKESHHQTTSFSREERRVSDILPLGKSSFASVLSFTDARDETNARKEEYVVGKSLQEEGDVTNVLKLLKYLHKLYSGSGFETNGMVNEDLFISAKLTRKILRQIEDPLLLAGKMLPTWMAQLSQHFPEVIPLKTRMLQFQLTAFDSVRTLHILTQALHQTR